MTGPVTLFAFDAQTWAAVGDAKLSVGLSNVTPDCAEQSSKGISGAICNVRAPGNEGVTVYSREVSLAASTSSVPTEGVLPHGRHVSDSFDKMRVSSDAVGLSSSKMPSTRSCSPGM